MVVCYVYVKPQPQEYRVVLIFVSLLIVLYPRPSPFFFLSFCTKMNLFISGLVFIRMEQHGHCDLREGPFSYILRRVQDQDGRKICWACAILSTMEYMLARVNSVDNELSLQVLLYSLWVNLHSRGRLKDTSYWRNGYDEVPLFELFRWTMIYGVGKASECESVDLHVVSFFSSSFFVKNIYVNNNKK